MQSFLVAMAGFTLAGAISPGPVNVVALSHGSQGQYPQAIAYVLGASLSYALVVAAMGLAGQSLLAIPAVERSAPWFCAAYLLWLAFHSQRLSSSSASSTFVSFSNNRSCSQCVSRAFYLIRLSFSCFYNRQIQDHPFLSE